MVVQMVRNGGEMVVSESYSSKIEMYHCNNTMSNKQNKKVNKTR